MFSDMDNHDSASTARPTTAVAGPSGTSRKRKRSISSSSSSSSSSNSSSSSSSGNKRGKRSRRHHRKRSKRAQRSGRMMEKLVKEMGELRKHIFTSSNNEKVFDDHVSLCSEASGELYVENNSLDERCVNDECHDFTFDIETKLKEPSVPKTPDSYLKMLSDVQRLGSTSWSEVRYADTQKLYNHTPGFVDLESNDEVKTYDTLRHLAHADKSYAALTYCVLKQKDTLQQSIRNLLLWAKNTNLNYDNLSAKVDDLFQKGDLHKTSSDLLQLVCGHRAESIEMRRESITSKVKDPLVKAALNRIPPSNNFLFDSEPFTTALEKAGGVRKAFWPQKTDGFSQGKPNPSIGRLSRGQGLRQSVVPSRGTQCCFQESGYPNQYMHMHACNNPPSRGGYQHNYPPRGQSSKSRYDQHNAGGRGSYQNQGSRPERSGNRGRSNGSRGSRGNQKRSYKQ